MRLSFHGAVEDVTGSCFLLETSAGKLLVDCGMHQGERMCSRKNLEPFDFEPSHLAAVLVTHAHFDHTGRLPSLVKAGFTGKIYMTPPTKALTEIILNDSVNVMRENAEKCGDEVPYDDDAVKLMLGMTVGIGYRHEFEVMPGVKATFHDAGHILGSAYVALDVQDGDESLKLVFSGDVGNDDVPILPDTDALQAADIVVCESTYGNKVHDPVSTRGPQLAAYVKEVIGRGGTLIIPAFSIERTQELLFELDKLFASKEIPMVPVYLDSPLAIRATEIYRHFQDYLSFDHPAAPGEAMDFFTFPSLHETLHSDESRFINEDKKPKIIIAGNGMMTGGRVLHHLKRYLGDERTGVLIVGFQADGTLGRQIQDGAQKVMIFNQEIPVKASVRSIEAFSAHGDKKKLAQWLKPEQGQVPRVFLVHGEGPVKEAFAEYLRKEIGAEVEIPRVTQVYELTSSKAHV